MSNNMINLQYSRCSDTDQRITDFDKNIDPENNFYDNLHNNCGYYTEQQFNNNIKHEHGISIIHFNSRSLYSNFQF